MVNDPEVKIPQSLYIAFIQVLTDIRMKSYNASDNLHNAILQAGEENRELLMMKANETIWEIGDMANVSYVLSLATKSKIQSED